MIFSLKDPSHNNILAGQSETPHSSIILRVLLTKFIINFIDYLKEVRAKIYKNMGEAGMAAIVECRTPQYSPFSIFSDIYNFMDLAKPLKSV